MYSKIYTAYHDFHKYFVVSLCIEKQSAYAEKIRMLRLARIDEIRTRIFSALRIIFRYTL